MEFKDRLKKYRSEKGLTQELLANKIYVSRSAIAKWEAGLGLPSDESVASLCEVLGVSRAELFPNKEAEGLLIEKNVKIKRRMIVAIVLAATLAVSLALFGFSMYNHYVISKQISAITPTVTKIFFEKVREDGDLVDFYEGKHLLYTNKRAHVLVEVTVDARLDISSVEVLLDNAYSFSCRLVDEKIDGADKRLYYRLPFIMKDTSAQELNIASATYSFYDRADLNEYKTKPCEVNVQPIAISVSNTSIARATLKFNAQTVISFEVEKGESAESAIFSLGKQEYLIEHLMNTNFSFLLDKIAFVGWEREDGLDLNEPIFEDLTLNACVEVKTDANFNFSTQDLQCMVFKSVRPVFYLDGVQYDNVLCSLRTQSDCVLIGENCEIKAVKPGTATIFADCDLGFFSSSVQFQVNISKEVFIDVFGYRKYLTPGGGAYYTGVYGVYSGYGRPEIEDEVLREITEYYNKQNQEFLEFTGAQRRFVELRWITNTLIVPIFETEYEFDTEAFGLSVLIGGKSVSVNDIQPITANAREVTSQIACRYNSVEGVDLEIEYYYIYDGRCVSVDEICADMGEITVCVNACVIKEGIYFYLPTYQIPIMLEGD
jgi:transcriptional regulator with XRE-family HTH domain